MKLAVYNWKLSKVCYVSCTAAFSGNLWFGEFSVAESGLQEPLLFDLLNCVHVTVKVIMTYLNYNEIITN